MQEINLNLAATEAQSAQRPLVVGLMLSTCPFCKALKRQHLNALVKDQRITYIDLVLDSAQTVRANEESMSVKTFAERSRANTSRGGRVLTPTLLFFDKQLKQVAEPLVGFAQDFYGFYIEERLAKTQAIISRTNN